jgi:hypothetical protein
MNLILFFVFDELMNLMSIWLYYVFDEFKQKELYLICICFQYGCIMYMYSINLWEKNCILYLMSLWEKYILEK